MARAVSRRRLSIGRAGAKPEHSLRSAVWIKEAMAMDWLINWWPATVLGPVVLIILFVYALWTRRRLSPREQELQRRAIEREYEDDRTD
jgi:hypothetical protein